MENRNALIVDAELTQADGYAERATALAMLARQPRRARRRTVAADEGNDTRAFVADCRDLASPPTSPRTPRTGAQPWKGEPPVTPGTGPANGPGHGSRNPSAGSRPSPAAASSATEADDATEPGSSSPPPPTTSSASPPSTTAPPSKTGPHPSGLSPSPAPETAANAIPRTRPDHLPVKAALLPHPARSIVRRHACVDLGSVAELPVPGAEGQPIVTPCLERARNAAPPPRTGTPGGPRASARAARSAGEQRRPVARHDGQHEELVLVDQPQIGQGQREGQA